MNRGENTGNVSTTGTLVTGGSGGTAVEVVTGAHKKTSGIEAMRIDGDKSARMVLASEEISSGQKMSDEDYK